LGLAARPWLSVGRVTGYITALHLPDFDSAVSDVVWFRDYAAYCGIATTAKGGLFVFVAQLGARRPVVLKQIGPWPQNNYFIPVCQSAKWQRLPMRVTMKPTGGEATTYDVVGTASPSKRAITPTRTSPRPQHSSKIPGNFI
jgi:hypothetical protein